jgi:hypothetical protein
MGIEQVKAANPGLIVKGVDDPAFAAYGRVLCLGAACADPSGGSMAPGGLEGLRDLADSITAIDQEANRYVASLPELEAHPLCRELALVFGGMDIQVGYCNGPNSALNGLEYHKSAEIDLAVTDLVLLLGLKSDIAADLTYPSRRLECFFLPAGCAVELWPEVLHYSPCRALASGFKSVIVLPRGTNAPLSGDESELAKVMCRSGGPGGAAARDPEARLLFMKNKWLLAHPERSILVERGAWPGIRGENIVVKPQD